MLVRILYFEIVQLAMRIIDESTWLLLVESKNFSEDKEDWDQYVERLDHFFAANGITVANKKRSVFLTVIGAKAYKQLRSLIAPAKPGETSYEDLTAAMKRHLTPAPSEIVQRFKFNS